MASLTIQAENVEAVRHIIESALSKEIALLQIGLEKTKARMPTLNGNTIVLYRSSWRPAEKLTI